MKVVIFDLDDTLYDYKLVHEKSLYKTFRYICNTYNVSLKKLGEIYKNVNEKIKYELNSTAASHSKDIYFKHIIEELKLPYKAVENVIDVYWNTFFNIIKPFKGVKTFIDNLRKMGLKIIVLTNYTMLYQMKKLKKLKLLDKIDKIYTSEEIGVEKPSEKMFYKILVENELKASECFMIGDNFNTDIQGAIKCGIFPFLFGESDKLNKKYITFKGYSELNDLFDSLFCSLKELSELCLHFGQRFDLTQAGGGNISVKFNLKETEIMFIKSSGVHLTEVTNKSNYTIIDNTKLRLEIDNPRDIKKYNYMGNKNRGSMETYMHSFLNVYTVHLHPMAVNRVLVNKDAKNILKTVYPEGLVIKYKTPGIELCKEIKKYYNNESVIFLLNHGIIVTHHDKMEVIKIVENLVEKFTNFVNKKLNYYKNVNLINERIKKDCVVHLSDASHVSCNFTFPDQVIYTGRVFKIKFIDEIDPETYIPCVVLIENYVYIVNTTYKKCLETESVLKAVYFINDKNDTVCLTENEISELQNSGAEKYRKLV